MKTIFRYLVPSILVSLFLFSSPGQAQVGGMKKTYVAAWGSSPSDPILSVPPDINGSYVVDIAVGHQHALALLADRMTIKGWGSNTRGESNTQNFGQVVIDLSAGEGYSMALLADGSVHFWGDTTRIPTAPVTGVVTEPGAIEAGNLHWLVKVSSTQVFEYLNTPTPLPPSPDSYGYYLTFPLPVVDLEAGVKYSLALLADGSVYYWVPNSNPNPPTPSPVRVLIGVRAEKGAIAAGDEHWLALMNNPTANVVYEQSFYAGGFTGFRQPFNQQIKELSAGTRSSLALFRDGTFAGWGDTVGGFYHPPSTWLDGGWFLSDSIPPIWLNKARVLEVGAGVNFGVAFYTLDVVPKRPEFPGQGMPIR